MVTIVFETHATSVDNELHLASGQSDCALSMLGRRQARELGARYADQHFATIFCSDLRRAVETAQIAFGSRPIPIIQDRRLRECDYGALTRHPNVRVDHERPGRITEPFPGGESYLQTALRLRGFLEELVAQYSGMRILIIGHRATWYGLEQWIHGIPLEAAVSTTWTWQPGWTYQLLSL